MTVFAVVLFVLAAVGLGFGILALGQKEAAAAAVCGAFTALTAGLGIAALNTEGPDCDKVYEPDGSYVETCEYPADE